MHALTACPALEQDVHLPTAGPDIEAAARAAGAFLQALGVNCDSPGMVKSARRMAQATRKC